MNDKNIHIDHRLSESKLEDLLKNSEVAYAQSKEEVWEQLSQRIAEIPVAKSKRLLPVRWIALAAMMLILIGIATLMKFHTTSIETAPTQQLAIVLPDGSQIALNAGSNLVYHPWWWRISREIYFEGEAFFEVQKGSPFQVISKKGKTVVLGTSFHINSKKGGYRVECVTGKVKVVSPSKNEVVLLPEFSASILINGKIEVERAQGNHVSSEGNDNTFSYTAVPLINVLQDVERHYNIKIETNISQDLIYTGHFKVKPQVDEVLNLLCKPFDLNFEKIAERKYRVN